MKQILKPLGHCLTTAVMTSAMLRVHAFPAVEAAVPEPVGSHLANQEASSASESAEVPQPTAVAPVQAVTPPEVVNPIEMAPTTPVAPTGSTPTHPKEPNAGSGSISPTAEADKPQGSGSQATPDPVKPQNPPISPEKASAPPTSTVAGMRQTVEKRLTEIAGKDKTNRNAQWQQNLVVSALQAAWKGEFEQARKIATHPALPASLQSELLGKIAVVEAQLQSQQVAQQTSSKQQAARPTNPQTGPSAPGRQTPSGSFSSVFPLATSYAGMGHQCPAITTTPPAAKAATKDPSPQTASKSGVPALVPSLGENLAAKLVQLSKNPPATVAAKPINLRQAFIAPESFVGVAAQSVRLKSTVNPAIAEAKSPTSAPKNQGLPSKPKAKAAVATSSAPIHPSTAAVAPHLIASPPSGGSYIPSPIAASTSLTPKTDRLLKTIDQLPLDQLIEQPNQPTSLSATTLDRPFEQFAISLVHFLPDPIQQVWHWWNPESAPLGDRMGSEPQIGLQSSPQLESPKTSAILPTENLTIAAQTGLNQVLLQSWSQEATERTQEILPIRSAYKFSIPYFSNTKATSAKLAQPVVFDANALLAASCARSQFANQFSDQVIDPATAKRHGWVNLMFPLPIPAVVTSVFGWRTHPISGNLSFHTGLDLGAPMGTPVLAASEGQVVAADSMGGYGLAVVVENRQTQQRNLYGHLSAIAVQPGTQVTAGTVLGWVGSTGNSTGPHLHFESMIHTESGWTAIDPLATAALASAKAE